MQEENKDKKGRFISLRIKLLIGFSVVFIIVFAGAFYWFNSFATDQAMERIEKDMLDTLNGAIDGVDGDDFQALAEDFLPTLAEIDPATYDWPYPEDERYWEHVIWLETVVGVEPRSLLYTYIEGDEPGAVRFIGSNGAARTPPEGAPFLVPYTPAPGSVIYKGLSDLTVNLNAYYDEWAEPGQERGYWVSAYAPITNSAGEKVGALGVDFRANYVLQVQKAIRDKVVIAFLITYTSLFILIFAVSAALSRPILELTKVAERIAEGDYEQDLTPLIGGNFPDEIETLTQVFDVMIDKVYEREQNLIRQVEELKIEIDVTKRQKQVSEIVDSTFFGNLQAQAQAMRSRRRRMEDERSSEDEEESTSE